MLQLAPPSKRSRKHIPETTAKHLPTHLGFSSSCSALPGSAEPQERASLWTPCPGRQQGQGQEGWPRLQLSAQSHPALQEGAQVLILPSQSSPTSAQPTPYMFCGSWPKYPGAAQPFITLIFLLFFSVFQHFLLHTDYPIMKCNLYIKSICSLLTMKLCHIYT